MNPLGSFCAFSPASPEPMTFSVTADQPRVEIPTALSSVAIRKNLYMLEMPWQSSMHKLKKDRPISCRDIRLGGKEDRNVTSHLLLLRLENYQQFLSSQSSTSTC